MSAERKVNSLLRSQITRRQFLKGTAETAAGTITIAASLPHLPTALIEAAAAEPTTEQNLPIEVPFEELVMHPEYQPPFIFQGDFANIPYLGTAPFEQKTIIAAGNQTNIIHALYDPKNNSLDQGNPMPASFEVGRVQPIDPNTFLSTDVSNSNLYLMTQNPEKPIHADDLINKVGNMFYLNNQIVFTLFKPGQPSTKLNVYNLQENQEQTLSDTDTTGDAIFKTGVTKLPDGRKRINVFTTNINIGDSPKLIKRWEELNGIWIPLPDIEEYDPNGFTRNQAAFDPINSLIAEKTTNFHGPEYRFSLVDEHNNRVILPLYQINAETAVEDLVAIHRVNSYSVALITKYSERQIDSSGSIFKSRYVIRQAFYQDQGNTVGLIYIPQSDIYINAISNMFESLSQDIPAIGQTQQSPHSNYPTLFTQVENTNGDFLNGVISPKPPLRYNTLISMVLRGLLDHIPN